MTQFLLALFLIGIGLSVAGTGTHLYQQLARKVAGLRVEGSNGLENIVSLFVVFICGPYLMLRLGMQSDSSGRVSTLNILLAATIAFGWSFVTGLMFVGTYISVTQLA
ncbi:DUF6949 family protein [Pelagibacterium lacus]|uniref:DUF6949 family protein n=1 Tax=Pelagibacterium lacus TaxID=2282655 RepID=UPI0011C07E82|nr:hypothetical protein [Pelagibacterium lacus]